MPEWKLDVGKIAQIEISDENARLHDADFFRRDDQRKVHISRVFNHVFGEWVWKLKVPEHIDGTNECPSIVVWWTMYLIDIDFCRYVQENSCLTFLYEAR